MYITFAMKNKKQSDLRLLDKYVQSAVKNTVYTAKEYE